jgi:nanoRNase/pAp phosphatase (c-di-AMP/oligoRNAs hydrolase)
MLSSDEQSALSDLFQKSTSILVILKSNPSFDQTAAAISLTMMLQAAKKQCHLACEQKLGDSFSLLSGFELVNQSVGNQSLQISFDYSENMVENVSYSIDQTGKKFNLVIRPKKGHHGLDPTTVEYAQVGIDADAIFLIGVTAFDQIQKFYDQDEAAFTQAHTVSINKQVATFAQTNIDVTQYTSTCEWLIHLVDLWKVQLTSEVATNLLAGIESSTDTFRHTSVTADTFQLIANLMRAGAKRLKLSASQQSSTSSLAQAFASKQIPNLTPLPADPAKPQPFMPSQWSPPAR